ncbi:MAG: RagB/SusD family nutrient uptake outer membrane protein [Prevotella sp.]|uniref:RagB/SusD family nutrient uptake outer membrane protein n=1 Tax=Prevotella sp. P5-92 TaxID=2024222 RepID=UPI0013032FBF|nr:RagB/SusD family nutrient uptake outer membrane protein [Prevotella sp. P5-92]MCI7399714.1 RagB/SusD family nutrient uptake outer membrane protein [Prevotella sp.]
MKRTLYSTILAVAVGSMALTSCEDQLDIEQKGVTTTDKFYKTDVDAEAALAAAYEGFMCNVVGRQPDMGGPGIYTPYKIITNMCGDDVLYASGNYGDHEFSGMLNEFRYDTEAEVPRFQYSGIYLSVYTCNLITDNFKDPDTPVKKRVVAEARVLRALDYFLLANLWGTPPFVTSVLAGDALPYNCDKDPENPISHEDLILWVAKECEEAAADLDERKSTADVDGAVRVTKGFAWALAGKAYLFAGKYDQAKANLKKVIDSGKYALVPGDRYMDNFHIEGDGNEEKVFEINFEYNAGKSGWGGMIQRSSWMEANAWNWRAGNFVTSPNKVYCGGLDGWGGLGVPQWFGDEFFANDGHSYRFDATLKHIDDAVYNMEYIDESINNMSLEEKKASKKIGISDPTQGLYGNSFWLAFKQVIRAADTGGKVYGDNIRLNNYIIMRYAEVLLNYAEACIQTGDAATAKTVINQIQQRAGSKTISASVDMEVLKREKSYELWLESCRWFDIMRWNDQTALARLEKVGTDVPHLFDKLFRTPSSSDRSVKWENGSEANSRFYTVSSSEAKDKGFDVGFKKGKHELFPFPQTVMDKNPNLEQNPGW